MQNGLVVNNVKPFNNLETTSTKRENKSIKEKGHGNRSCESLSTAAKHFKVKKSKANIYLIVDFRICSQFRLKEK